ncbi:MAG: NAD-binding protein [Bacilli bacterium]
MKDSVIVIGAGKLGAKLARLLNENGENVLVADKQSDAFYKLDDFSGFTIVGDATDLDFLKSIDIEDSKMVIITTNDDNVNIFLAEVCFYIFAIKKIYVRLSDTDKGKLLENTSIKGIYPFNLSVDFFCQQEKETR